jgi:hypothetical protein
MQYDPQPPFGTGAPTAVTPDRTTLIEKKPVPTRLLKMSTLISIEFGSSRDPD